MVQVQSIRCSCRGPGFGCQFPCSRSQASLSLVPGSPSSEIHWDEAGVWWTGIQKAKHSFKKHCRSRGWGGLQKLLIINYKRIVNERCGGLVKLSAQVSASMAGHDELCLWGKGSSSCQWNAKSFSGSLMCVLYSGSLQEGPQLRAEPCLSWSQHFPPIPRSSRELDTSIFQQWYSDEHLRQRILSQILTEGILS